ncbi:hypothetical protein LTR99_003724 [Exophiala xenobiotica]|uniref:Conidiation-specific protein 6 n=1 Tax=Vermiconidia calcicola TaxID=1690605 RepID=A0AAV9Q0E3_9PEZI|nr:hypothetical protein H2202_007449 [Exophiala xenobiotica]KAK5531417.1 hypothetical protein LTR25_008526 [Vermiconidia calcicola]KAK5544796.1 hypothetical protein LTR23_004236 [Chaetothyriales sp. CCFEE 6169]KAK5191451.1 hypothetical protein LTR92_008622 [Exophiala xenobiotica]KAK5207136.1 hypothetical protein LTR41_007203 [Exophiala xenobiotica]
MADNLRDQTEPKQKAVLGDKAVGGTDNDADHVPNVERGLKAAISNPNTSQKAKEQAQKKLDAVE